MPNGRSEMTDTMVSVESVHQAIRDYPDADNPSSFLAVSEGNSYFSLPDKPGVIVYRTAGNYLVQFGGAFAPPGRKPSSRRRRCPAARSSTR